MYDRMLREWSSEEGVSEELDFFRSSKNPVESGVQRGTETDGRKEMHGRTGYQGV